MIPYGRQDITQADLDAVATVLRSDFLTQGTSGSGVRSCGGNSGECGICGCGQQCHLGFAHRLRGVGSGAGRRIVDGAKYLRRLGQLRAVLRG
jgi:hypothetical protein